MGKILVTGGTVFVSRYVAEYFAKRGDQIFVLNRGSRPQSHGVTLIQGDRGNLGTVLKMKPTTKGAFFILDKRRIK